MVASPPAPLDALADDLQRLDPVAVASAVEALAGTGTPLEEVFDRTVLPAWERVDARSAAGEVDRAVASAAAALARRAVVGSSRACPPGSPAPAGSWGALCVLGPAGPADLLRSEALAEAASAAGWSVQQVSGADSAGELAALVRACRPQAVVVTAHDPGDLLGLLPALGVAHAGGIPVLSWGPAFGPRGRRNRRVGAAGWAAGLSEVVGTLAAWREEAPDPVAPLPLPPAYRELEAARPAMVDAGATAGDAAWARRAAHALVDQLLAAVVLEEPGILDEHLARERHGRSGQPGDAGVAGLVDAVASALPPGAGVARDYLAGARDQLRRSSLGSTRPFHRGAGGPEAGGSPQVGQVFADLLVLAALSCQTQLALLSVPQAPGQWRTLSYGFEVRTGLDDRRLFDLIAARRGPVEIADLTLHPELSRSPLGGPPHNLRWAYGVALGQDGGPVLGVVVVLDRWLRQATRREQRALAAVARQAAEHLAQLRRLPGVQPGHADPTSAAQPGGSAGSVADAGFGDGRGKAPGVLEVAARHDPLGGLVSLRRPGSAPDGQQLLRSHEVAVLFDVTERTVINWAASGKLPSLRTIGGHLRFRREDVLGLLDDRSHGLRARRSS